MENEERPKWLDRHWNGINIILALSLYWAMLIKEIEDIKDRDTTKKEKRMLKQFNNVLKKIEVDRKVVRKVVCLDYNTNIKDRLELMSCLAE